LSAAQNDIRERIEDFLSQKRLAVVGVSRQPEDFTLGLFRESCRRGYDVVPVECPYMLFPDTGLSTVPCARVPQAGTLPQWVA
jgi:hypothetical protein